MRILVLQTVAQWVGNINEQAYLELPPGMDMESEESNWFAKGGGSLRDFVNYLTALGAKELTGVETWTIRYQ